MLKQHNIIAVIHTRILMRYGILVRGVWRNHRTDLVLVSSAISPLNVRTVNIEDELQIRYTDCNITRMYLLYH